MPATMAASNQTLRNEIANLPKQVQFRPGCQAFACAFRPVVWQGCAQPSSFSFRSDGTAVHVYMRRNVLVTNSLAPDSYRSGINRNIKLVNMKIDVR
jgi:hypothetical protein